MYKYMYKHIQYNYMESTNPTNHTDGQVPPLLHGCVHVCVSDTYNFLSGLRSGVFFSFFLQVQAKRGEGEGGGREGGREREREGGREEEFVGGAEREGEEGRRREEEGEGGRRRERLRAEQQVKSCIPSHTEWTIHIPSPSPLPPPLLPLSPLHSTHTHTHNTYTIPPIQHPLQPSMPQGTQSLSSQPASQPAIR